MKLNLKRGMTLIEILIAISILVIVFGLGLFISIDAYKGFSTHSEIETIVSTIEKARGESLSNINQTRHGVHIVTGPLRYIIFDCPSASPQCTTYTAGTNDLVISPSYNVSIPNPPLPLDIIFDQLSGCLSTAGTSCQAPTVSISVSDGTRTYNITINSQGRIDW